MPKLDARLLVLSVVWASLAGTILAAPRESEEDLAARIVGAALVDGRPEEKLAWLTDRIGHRLSGSAALDRAIAWAVAELRRDGIEQVRTEPVLVPHWVRGEEAGQIVAPVDSEVALLALGGSVGTPAEGLRAGVVEVSDFDELRALGDGARGKIVLFNKPIRPGFDSESGYGSAVGLRTRGPSEAARYGAVGMLIRSLGTADFRLPHTGAMRYEEDLPKIPAAAIAAEDADLIHRLLASGDEVRLWLKLTSRTLPDVESANVIADLPGREKPEEIVLIGAHLDSWDVGQGAHDDGAGCAIVLETMRLLKRLDLVPRRTLRAVLFTNEENGLRGGRDYARRHGGEAHVVAIESDSGGGAPVGFGVTAGPGGVELVRAIVRRLTVVGADDVGPGGGGADVSRLRPYGVPLMSLRQESSHYFDYHHTAADTLDKIDPDDLRRNVAALALMAYTLAEREASLPHPDTTPEATH